VREDKAVEASAELDAYMNAHHVTRPGCGSMCMYIYMNVYVNLYVCVHLYIYIDVHMEVDRCTNGDIHVLVGIYVCICMCTGRGGGIFKNTFDWPRITEVTSDGDNDDGDENDDNDESDEDNEDDDEEEEEEKVVKKPPSRPGKKGEEAKTNAKIKAVKDNIKAMKERTDTLADLTEQVRVAHEKEVAEEIKALRAAEMDAELNDLRERAEARKAKETKAKAMAKPKKAKRKKKESSESEEDSSSESSDEDNKEKKKKKRKSKKSKHSREAEETLRANNKEAVDFQKSFARDMVEQIKAKELHHLQMAELTAKAEFGLKLLGSGMKYTAEEINAMVQSPVKDRTLAMENKL